MTREILKTRKKKKAKGMEDWNNGILDEWNTGIIEYLKI
jgi:hypothetical protein